MRGLSLKTKTLIEYAYRLLAANRPMTLRQLHYAIFSAMNSSTTTLRPTTSA